jgi:hypothetical protein
MGPSGLEESGAKAHEEASLNVGAEAPDLLKGRNISVKAKN